jgi:hypothetical protein
MWRVVFVGTLCISIGLSRIGTVLGELELLLDTVSFHHISLDDLYFRASPTESLKLILNSHVLSSL